MLLTEMKIQSEAYLHNCFGYNVTCLANFTSSDRGAHVSVGLVTQEMPIGWGIEFTRYHRLNVVICKIFTGLTRTPPVGVNLKHSMLEQLPDLEEDLQSFREPIVLGDLNVELNGESISPSQRVSDLLAEYGIIYLVWHFRQHHRFCDLKTWSQVRQGTFLRLRCD